MQREIKFRGQRVDNGSWVVGDLCCMFTPEKKCIMPDSFYATRHFVDDDDENPVIEDSLAIGGFYPVNPDTVCQFIGLKDKNGLDIYEGDINQDLGVVVWNKDSASFCWDYKNTELMPCEQESDWCIIIGNIHENES